MTQGLDVEALGAKVKPLLPLLREKGEVYLLALFERDDVPDRLDLAISSEWADSSRNAAVKLAVSHLGPLLSPEERLALSRVVVIPSSVPMVTLLAANFANTGSVAEVVNCNFNGVQINHGWVFYSKAPPPAYGRGDERAEPAKVAETPTDRH